MSSNPINLQNALVSIRESTRTALHLEMEWTEPSVALRTATLTISNRSAPERWATFLQDNDSLLVLMGPERRVLEAKDPEELITQATQLISEL